MKFLKIAENDPFKGFNSDLRKKTRRAQANSVRRASKQALQRVILRKKYVFEIW